MDNFKVIYRILKYLEEAMDYECIDRDKISYQTLGITEPRWARTFEMMYDDGYIKGVHVTRLGGESYPGIKFDNLQITLDGLEYLDENSAMQKAKNFFKEIKETVPGL